jgi:hypothetical protein
VERTCSTSFVVEGTLRSIISEKPSDEIELAIQKGLSEGRNEPSKPEQLMYKFTDEVELQGGWKSLKNQYFSISIFP